ncbi:hypothetical protein L3Y34_003566 [Caenorhabditis briggsae]|uniref:ISXO2-like transposase domain-containing protein n=1 Tax=Caenorhabditis briggsae TaxID=6238 RepID=A0AAE9A9D5_CAEBR|nr:hypothetical protein L3Y34_003566 [Caenorhabditis briggsae]
MGCTPSRTDFQPDAHSDLFRPPAPIPVTIGSSVGRSLQSNQVSVGFIFGGPASRKGSIIEELTGSFNFVSISVEDIVFQYLPTRLSGTGTQIKDIQEALRNDDGILNIDWILEMISSRIAVLMSQRFIIDIVPTVSSILKAEGFRARTQSRSLEQFEMKHKIAFAIDVTVKDEQSLTRLNGEANGKDDDSKKINPELNQMMRSADDIDRGKIEKRIAEYHTAAEPFISYFRKSNRLISMTLTTEAVPNLVNTTRETLLKLGFTITRKDDHVICFTTENSHDEIDFPYYKLKVVNASELSRPSADLVAMFRVKQRDAATLLPIIRAHVKPGSMIVSDGWAAYGGIRTLQRAFTHRWVNHKNAQITAVYRYISSHGRHDDNFLVVVPSFQNQKTKTSKPRINFMEKKKEVYLDEFIKNKQHDKPPKTRIRISVNSISSSRQTFLFFEPFPQSFACTISSIYREQKDNLYSRKNKANRATVDGVASSRKHRKGEVNRRNESQEVSSFQNEKLVQCLPNHVTMAFVPRIVSDPHRTLFFQTDSTPSIFFLPSSALF